MIMMHFNTFLREADNALWIAERERRTQSIQHRLRRKIATVFRAQGAAFLGGLPLLRNSFLMEASPREQWLLILDAANEVVQRDFLEVLEEAHFDAFAQGGEALAARFELSFDLENPRAVAYLRDSADRQITKINQTTKNRIDHLMSKAVQEGWSYERTAQEIQRLFKGFSDPPLIPNRNFPTRAHAVAVFEVGDKYEGGLAEAAQQLEDAGLDMEKAWLTVGDNRVRRSHRDNQSQGYIGRNAAFTSGHNRPPTDSGCRCSSLYRMKK